MRARVYGGLCVRDRLVEVGVRASAPARLATSGWGGARRTSGLPSPWTTQKVEWVGEGRVHGFVSPGRFAGVRRRAPVAVPFSLVHPRSWLSGGPAIALRLTTVLYVP